MTTAKQQAMIWMNTTFGADIEKAVKNTAIAKNLLIAIGIQETYYIWAGVYKSLSGIILIFDRVFAS